MIQREKSNGVLPSIGLPIVWWEKRNYDYDRKSWTMTAIVTGSNPIAEVTGGGLGGVSSGKRLKWKTQDVGM